MPSNVQQPKSAELEFDAYKDNLNDHFKLAQADWNAQFDLPGLEQAVLLGFQKRSVEEFKKNPSFLETWFISKSDLKQKAWKKAFTFKANEGVAAHFKGKSIPQSSVTHSAGVDVVSWEGLLKKYKNNKYLKTNRTLNDYANESKEAILEVKDLVGALAPNTGKLVQLRNGMSVYTALVEIAGKKHIAFSSINQLEVAGLWARLYNLVY